MPLKTVRFFRPGSFEEDGTYSQTGYYHCSLSGDQSGEYVPLAVHQKWIDDLAKERDVLKEKNAALSDNLAESWEQRDQLALEIKDLKALHGEARKQVDRLRDALKVAIPWIPKWRDKEIELCEQTLGESGKEK